VTVTVSVASRLYGFTVGPPDLGFNLAGTPTVVVSYGRYGDRSVFDSSAKYASPAEFESALALWRELAPDVWNPARNSAHTGSGTIASGLDFPGAYLIAAPK